MKLNTFSILLFFTDWSTSLKSTSICLLPTPISLIGTVFLLHFKFFLNNIKEHEYKNRKYKGTEDWNKCWIFISFFHRRSVFAILLKKIISLDMNRPRKPCCLWNKNWRPWRKCMRFCRNTMNLWSSNMICKCEGHQTSVYKWMTDTEW